MNKNLPNTMNMDRDLYIDDIYNEINEKLSSVGIVVPVVVATFTIAAERLRRMNAIGALAMQESALRTRATPRKGVAEQISDVFNKRYDKMLKRYLDYPQKLFAGEADDTGAYNTKVLIRPRGDSLWSYNVENDVEPIDFDDYI